MEKERADLARSGGKSRPEDLGASGLSGLIALGIIIALFSRKHT